VAPAKRDYDRPKHRRERARLQALLRAGEILTCWRCRGPIALVSELHVGHDDDDRTIIRGPEHRLCNLRAAAAKTNRKRKAKRRRTPRSREWGPP
jgi:hypothetical protein